MTLLSKLKTAGFALATMAMTSASFGATFTGNAVGSWANPSATGSTYTISNNDDQSGAASVASFDFGTASSSAFTSNLFTFNGVGSGTPAGFTTPGNTPFDIGAFTYRNGTTNTSSYPAGHSSVTLGIVLTLSSPIINASTFLYDFGINITPNGTGSVAGDADTVTIGNNTTATNFMVGGTAYTLSLLGFSQDGGLTFTNTFVAPEQTQTGADVFATITTNVLAVPEPTTWALFAMAMVGMGLLRRARG